LEFIKYMIRRGETSVVSAVGANWTIGWTNNERGALALKMERRMA
jgi:hypothetical protein